MLRKLLLMIGFGLVLVFNANTPTVFSQDNACQSLVQDALQTIGSACATMGRNEACYGHTDVAATFADGASSAGFQSSGDVVSLDDLTALFTRPADPATGVWGIALMTVLADLPADVDSSVTFVLLGDTEVTSATPASGPTCTVTNNGTNNINVRGGPSTNNPIVNVLSVGETAIADGRNATNDWVRVNYAGTTGWLFASLVDLDCDINTLIEVGGTAFAASTPMQAVTLTSNNTSGCEMAPDGLLIRSPNGRRANVVVNGVQLTFSSAGLLTTDSSSDLTILGIQGVIEVMADGQMTLIFSGSQTTVPPGGPPGPVETVTPGPADPTIQSVLSELSTNAIGTEICQVTTALLGPADVRDEPGLSHPVTTTLQEDTMVPVVSLAVLNEEGTVWWELETGGWVNSDDILTVGDCHTVPYAEEYGSSDQGASLLIDNCEMHGPHHTIKAGQIVYLGSGIGRADTIEAAEAAFGSYTATISVDGVALPDVNQSEIQWHTDGEDPPGYGKSAYVAWEATHGTHTITVEWTNGFFSNSCTIIVES